MWYVLHTTSRNVIQQNSLTKFFLHECLQFRVTLIRGCSVTRNYDLVRTPVSFFRTVWNGSKVITSVDKQPHLSSHKMQGWHLRCQFSITCLSNAITWKTCWCKPNQFGAHNLKFVQHQNSCCMLSLPSLAGMWHCSNSQKSSPNKPPQPQQKVCFNSMTRLPSDVPRLKIYSEHQKPGT